MWSMDVGLLCLDSQLAECCAVDRSNGVGKSDAFELARPRTLIFGLDLHFRMGSICEHQILRMNKYWIPWLWWLITRLSPFWKHSLNGGRGTFFVCPMQLLVVLTAYMKLSSKASRMLIRSYRLGFCDCTGDLEG